MSMDAPAKGAALDEAPARGWRAIFPPGRWLPAYQPRWLPHDAIAGVTLAAYGIPVSLAYASLAGLPPQYGVYGYLAGGLAYALFGSSRQLAIGPTSAISLLVGTSVAEMVASNPEHGPAVAALAALGRPPTPTWRSSAASRAPGPTRTWSATRTTSPCRERSSCASRRRSTTSTWSTSATPSASGSGPRLRAPGLLVIDLSSSPAVDVAGARMLASLQEALRTAGTSVRLVGARASVRDLLRAERLEERVGAIDRRVTVADVVDEHQRAAASPASAR